ncbi:MAG: hypothetical protein PHW95_00140 [Patescibacteria group bacterium]|nr:hypothetical protein [Patescibacteria group bacterium]
MPNSLEKIIELIKKTGDNCVVLDSSGNPAYVVLSFDDYKKLVADKSEIADLTEDELLNKINRDIAIWRVKQQEAETNNWEPIESLNLEPKVEPSAEEKSLNKANIEEESDRNDEKYYFEPID